MCTTPALWTVAEKPLKQMRFRAVLASVSVFSARRKFPLVTSLQRAGESLRLRVARENNFKSSPKGKYRVG